jgi:hypothetical protein
MKDSLLLKCLLVSAALHAVAVPIFIANPIHFHPSLLTVLGKTPPTPIEESEISILEKEAALEEAMKHFVVLSSQQQPHDTVKSVAFDTDVSAVEEKQLVFNSLSLPASKEIVLPEVLPTQPLSLPDDAFSHAVLDHSLALAPNSPAIEPSRSNDNPFESLALRPYDNTAEVAEGALDFEFFPSQEAFQTPALASPTIPSASALVATDAFLLSKQEVMPEESPPLSQTPKSSAPPTLHQPVVALQYSIPSMASYGIPEFNTLEWNDVFNVDVKTYEREDGGYLFSLTFLPKSDLIQYRLKQNYYFLIDRSNSIEKNRYQSFRRAVSRSIGCLREGDNFNIIVFDSKAVRFNEFPVPFNKKTQMAADEFLEKQNHGHYGAATDIYASLGKIIPIKVNDNEAHTAILISDGDSHQKPDKQRNMINAWLEANRGRVTLYTAAVGQGNNLSILDLLGTVSRGSLLYSDTHTGFPRKLAKLVLSVRSPIAQEMSFSMIGTDPSAAIELYPSSARLPYLFSDHPFVLFGRAEKLSDFTLILQGRNQDQILSIKKNISFDTARPNRLLAKQWATYKAHLLYEQYLQEGKTALLEEAKKLLENDPAHSRR